MRPSRWLLVLLLTVGLSALAPSLLPSPPAGVRFDHPTDAPCAQRIECAGAAVGAAAVVALAIATVTTSTSPPRTDAVVPLDDRPRRGRRPVGGVFHPPRTGS